MSCGLVCCALRVVLQPADLASFCGMPRRISLIHDSERAQRAARLKPLSYRAPFHWSCRASARSMEEYDDSTIVRHRRDTGGERRCERSGKAGKTSYAAARATFSSIGRGCFSCRPPHARHVHITSEHDKPIRAIYITRLLRGFRLQILFFLYSYSFSGWVFCHRQLPAITTGVTMQALSQSQTMKGIRENLLFCRT